MALAVRACIVPRVPRVPRGPPPSPSRTLLAHGLLNAVGVHAAVHSLWDVNVACGALAASGLLYEELLVLAGRVITRDGTRNLELLDILHDVRFLVHSCFPFLGFVGCDALLPHSSLKNGVALACVLVGALSYVRNTFLLGTRMKRQDGLVVYTYEDEGPDFTRRIPVAFSAVVLAVVGASASAWCLVLGAAWCLLCLLCTTDENVVVLNSGQTILVASLLNTVLDM